MYPFSGQLIDGHQSYQWLKNSFKGLEGEALVCGAFLKANIVTELESLIPPGAGLKVLTRWQLGDLIAGASDLHSYEICRARGWPFYIKLNFHGKVFLVPNSGILVGSANPTSSGFGLKPNSNSEVGTVVGLSSENIDIVNHLFDDSILMTDELYAKLRAIVESHEGDAEKIVWPRVILNQIEKSDYSEDKLLLTECFRTDGDDIGNAVNLKDEDILADLSLLGVYGPPKSRVFVDECFLATKIYKWLYSVLEKNEKSMSFGGITAALHNALLEDPAPYRREVKKLVQNLFAWVVMVGPEATGIEHSRPNHAEVLRII